MFISLFLGRRKVKIEVEDEIDRKAEKARMFVHSSIFITSPFLFLLLFQRPGGSWMEAYVR